MKQSLFIHKLHTYVHRHKELKLRVNCGGCGMAAFYISITLTKHNIPHEIIDRAWGTHYYIRLIDSVAFDATNIVEPLPCDDVVSLFYIKKKLRIHDVKGCGWNKMYADRTNELNPVLLRKIRQASQVLTQ